METLRSKFAKFVESLILCFLNSLLMRKVIMIFLPGVNRHLKIVYTLFEEVIHILLSYFLK